PTPGVGAPRRPPYPRLDRRSDTEQDDSADSGQPRRQSSTSSRRGPADSYPEPLPEEPSVTVESLAALRHTLLRAIDAHETYIGIIGQGYVGLPLALTFVDKGFRVLGFDVDGEKVVALNRGDCYIRHIDRARVKRARDTKA